jgi:hypothetical protein
VCLFGLKAIGYQAGRYTPQVRVGNGPRLYGLTFLLG